jgi:hypothetical protein
VRGLQNNPRDGSADPVARGGRCRGPPGRHSITLPSPSGEGSGEAGPGARQVPCQYLDLVSLSVREPYLLISVRPPWCRIVPMMHWPVRRVRPRDNFADVPDRASCQPRDRRREGGRASSLPHVHSVRVYSEHEPDLLRACEMAGVVHRPTIGGSVGRSSARCQHFPTEISYTSECDQPVGRGASRQ